MVNFSSFLLVFIAVFYANITDLGHGLRIEVVPASLSKLVSTDLDITCIADGPAFWSQDVITIGIMKTGEKPIAVIRKQGITQGPSIRNNMKVRGHVEKDASKSYLQLSIDKPDSTNTGGYLCQMFYMDEFSQIKEMRAEANVTIANEDISEIVSFLLEKVTVLEDKAKEHENLISDQETVIQEQAEQLKRHQNYTKDQVTVLENKVLGQEYQIGQIAQKQNISSAFYATKAANSKVRTGETVQFSKVFQNTGNNFDKGTGIYTAPVDGLYAFTLYATSWNIDLSGNTQTRIHILVDNVTMARLLVTHTNHHSQSSVSCVVKMKKGQTAKCNIDYITHETNGILGFPYTGFVGHLLQAL